MTEQELREKVYDIMARVLDDTFFPCTRDSIIKRMTDALTVAGIEYVRDYKHRAEVAEKIAKEACEIVFCEAIDNEEWDEVIRNYKETKEKYSDEFGITDEMLYDYLHEKAEKELQEE